MWGTVHAILLAAFPRLQRLEHITINAEAEHILPYVVPAVQRYASSAQCWAWDVQLDDRNPGTSTCSHVQRGSLAAVINLEVSSKDWQGHSHTGDLSRLLAAAPQVTGLCISSEKRIGTNVHGLLQPLQHAVCMHTLWLNVRAVVTQNCRATLLAEAAAVLTQPVTAGSGRLMFSRSSRLAVHCCSLRHICLNGDFCVRHLSMELQVHL